MNKGEGSATAGAASRIGPVGLYFRGSARLREKAEASAHITHAHPVGINGAAVQAWAVAQVATADPGERFPFAEFCEGILRFATTSEIRQRLAAVVALLAERAAPDAAAKELVGTSGVVESLPFALFAFVSHPNSYQDCLFCAVLHGGKKDALGAMASAISGAYLGAGAIPTAWRAKLENEATIRALAELLYEHDG